MLCRLVAVSPSGFHKWQRQVPTGRARLDAELLQRIRALLAQFEGSATVVQVVAALRAEGIRASRKRVTRVMLQANLRRGAQIGEPGQ